MSTSSNGGDEELGDNEHGWRTLVVLRAGEEEHQDINEEKTQSTGQPECVVCWNVGRC